MRNLFKILLVVVLIVFNHDLTAQQAGGGHPAGIKWRFIKTKNIRVIFPEGQEEKAGRIATIIDIMAENHAESIGDKKQRIDLVLQTNQVLSNGYVALGPFKSEFFATAMQNNHYLGNLDWLDQLAIHEYRHVQQFANGRRGLTKIMYWLEGHAGWSWMYAFSVPDWYSEGDAVMTETALTNGGRGRSPYFFGVQRALLLNGKEYKYKKLRNGSYQDLLPDHYNFGYGLINYARNEFGANVWEKIHREASQYRIPVYPFAFAVKKHTGYFPGKLYQLSNNHQKELWEKELDTLELTQQIPLVRKPRTVTNYRNPHYLEDGSVVYVKSSFSKIQALYQLQNGKEEKLTEIGIEPEGYLTINGSKAAWTELRIDPRRSNRNYSVIKSYDLNTKEKRTVTKKGKYFSPHFNSDGTQIVAVQANEELANNLVLIDSDSGQITDVIENKENDFVVMPKWTEDDQAVIYIAKRNSRLAFFEYDITTKKTVQLSDWTTHTIGNFNIKNGSIYYSASYSGIDNIYELSLAGDRKINQITSVKIGAYMPAISEDGATLIMCEQTEKGRLLTELDLYHGINKSIKVTPPAAMARFEVSLGETDKNILDSIPDREYEVKKYRGLFRGHRLVGWSLTQAAANYQMNLQFTNILDNTSANIGAEYYRNQDIYKYGANVTYSFLYPLLRLGVEKYKNSRKFNKNYYGGIIVPFSFIRGNYFTDIELQSYYEVLDYKNNYFDPNKNRILTDDLHSLTHRFSFSNVKRTALQNVNYRGGQSLIIQHSKAMSAEDAELFSANAKLHLPGIGANHSIMIEGAYQKDFATRDVNSYFDEFVYARGYYNSIKSIRVARVSLDYQLPLFNIDKGLGGVYFFKRAIGGAFVDVSSYKETGTQKRVEQNSVGFDFLLETRMFTLFDVFIGMRHSYRFNVIPSPEVSQIMLEPIIGVGF